MCPTAVGQISLKVYEADGVTPFDCNDDIMVGTKLILIVSSDNNDTWSGGLFVAQQDRELGALVGRDWDPNAIVGSHIVIGGDWTGSHFEEAGDMARVVDWNDSSIYGFDLYSSVLSPNDWPGNPNAGDWFVIDYYAEEVGDCNVGFYDYNIDWNEPALCVTFSHVPTRDLDYDGVVNFNDFGIFAPQWNATDCNDPNWCDGADLERDGDVDYNDLELFAEYWLWPTSANEPNEPNTPADSSYPEDPNIIYSIVDVNGANEITINVNDSITLYVDIATTDANDVWFFDIEVGISDTNLGSIDNTEYPSGTARILAEPNRDSYWDYWGLGLEQEEGIRLRGMTTGCAIADGHLASFVFTCENQGDVTLELINWFSVNTDDRAVFPKLESIVIHQVDPYSQQMMGGEMGGIFGMEEGQQSQTTQENNIDELVDWLEEIWAQHKEIRESCTKKEWDEFIDKVEDSYQ
jgi:hypothetical protein